MIDTGNILLAVAAFPTMAAAGFLARRVWDRIEPWMEARAAKVADRAVREPHTRVGRWWLLEHRGASVLIEGVLMGAGSLALLVLAGAK